MTAYREIVRFNVLYFTINFKWLRMLFRFSMSPLLFFLIVFINFWKTKLISHNLLWYIIFLYTYQFLFHILRISFIWTYIFVTVWNFWIIHLSSLWNTALYLLQFTYVGKSTFVSYYSSTQSLLKLLMLWVGMYFSIQSFPTYLYDFI